MNKSILIFIIIFINHFSYGQKIKVKYNENTHESYFVNSEGQPLSKQEFSKVYRLNLSHQNIRVLPKEIIKFDNLRSLNLSHNQLTTLPPKLWELYRLYDLDLSYNQLMELPEEGDWWRFRDFESLNLSHNNLKSLPKNLWELYDLKRLDLSHNQLDSIPTEIFKLIELEELDISHNQLPKILPYLKELPKMEKLNFEGNPLQEELSEADKKLTFAHLAKTEKFQPEEGMINLGKIDKSKKLVLKLGQKLYYQDYESGSKLDYVLFEIEDYDIIEQVAYHKAYSKPQIHRPGYTGTTGGKATTVFEAKKVGKTKLIIKVVFRGTYKQTIKAIVKP